MKIGEFAKQNKVTIDTIRHYMDLGLITSIKKGSQYEFDYTCQKELLEINRLKDMGFTLHEIKKLLYFKKFNMTNLNEENNYYKSFFVYKYEYMKKEIDKYLGYKNKLKSEIDRLDKNISNLNSDIGINIKALNLLACHKCNNELILEDAHIVKNQIISGKLCCSCGVEYVIENGILYVNKEDVNTLENCEDDEYIDPKEYMDVLYLQEICNGLEWFNKKKVLEGMNNKSILDLGSGIGLGLRYFYDELDSTTTYIAIDNDGAKHRFLRKVIGSSEKLKNVIFICCDFKELPIKKRSIDMIIDGSGSSSYGFKNKEFLLSEITDYINNGSKLVGFYLIFDNFDYKNSIPLSFRDNFRLDKIKDNIRRLGYNILDENKGKYLVKTEKRDDFFLKDEKVYFYTCYADL